MLGLGHGGPYNGVAQSPSVYATTPMMLDILAAQRLYGRPISGPLVDGNDVFGFHSNIDENSDPDHSIARYFNFTVNTHPVITIWDGGVNNTLDLSEWSEPSTINLNPGTFSSANGQTNNIGIAPDTVIETAKGGEGNDTIIGNAYANFLFGNAGDDQLFGNAGDDSLNGGQATTPSPAGWVRIVSCWLPFLTASIPFSTSRASSTIRSRSIIPASTSAGPARSPRWA
jgi:Peptidase M10 serralysin C terminal